MRILFSPVLQKYAGVAELAYPWQEGATIRDVAAYLEQAANTDKLKFACTYMILINGRRIAQASDIVAAGDVLTLIPVIQGG